MRFPSAIAALAASCLQTSQAQQYAGDVIETDLPAVPRSELAFFRVHDASGKNSNLTLINYYSHGESNQRLVESNIQRAVVVVHGLNRDPATYMSNMLSALSQVKSDPNVNLDTVAIIAPYFPNGEDKGKGYPWTDGLKPARGSTSNALVWKASQWSAGGNNQYPYTSTSTSSYTVLDQIVQYFDDQTLFPKMNQIVIAGHSLGAQTVQRYVALGNQLNTKSPVSYWIGNPSSYVWLSTSRPLSTSSCPTFDDYRDGFNKFVDYPMTYGRSLISSGRSAILANYQSKAVNYARGTQDLGDGSSSCAPRTTGSDRNERFFNFIKAFPPSCSNPNGRDCDTVDFVNMGHDSGGMMASAAGQARLFLDNFYGRGHRSYDFGYPRQQTGDDPFPNPDLNRTAAATNNNTYAGNMTYWGCWSDQDPKTLTHITYTSDANTIELCTKTCADGGHTIAGLEYGTQCFCGKSLGYLATQAIESSCSFRCPGNSTQQCGGSGRLSLFSHGRPALQEAPGTPEVIGNFYYVSCYTEASDGVRALASTGTSSQSMTLDQCASFCSGYRYFGTEYGGECYCGNDFSAGARRTSDGECNMLCSGATNQFCGAGNRLTVYQDPDWTTAAASSPSTPATSTTRSASSGSGPAPVSTAVTCPSSDGTTTAASGGKHFTIECGVDHAAGDLTSLSVTSLAQCIDACAQNDKCVVLALSGSACYLKSSVGAPVRNGVWGARLATSSPPTSQSSSPASSTTSTAASPGGSTGTSRAASSPTSSASASTSTVASTAESGTGTSSSRTWSSGSSTATASSNTPASATEPTRTTVLAASALASGYSPAGCHIDSVSSRVLPKLGGSTSSNTPQRCALACRGLGYKYSGTEYGAECWCGNQPPPPSAQAPSSDCNMKCAGDPTQVCGAGNRLSLVIDAAHQPSFFIRRAYRSMWAVDTCYTDSGPRRTLEHAVSLAAPGGSSEATVATCLDACDGRGYPYCGLEYASECWGAMDAPGGSLAAAAAGAADDQMFAAGCDYACAGNRTESCGGASRLLLYRRLG